MAKNKGCNHYSLSMPLAVGNGLHRLSKSQTFISPITINNKK
jgi:hypothetical protein